MHGLSIWKSVGRPVRLLLFAAAMAWSTFLWAQSASPPGKERLYIGSPPSVLDGPIVKRCRLLAGRRSDPQLNSVTTAVDKAVDTFNLKIIFDAVATCRAALAAYPTEPKVIIAHYNASESLSALMLGLSFPDSEKQALDLVLQMSKEKETSATSKQALSFFLGSAYEYGVGTPIDLSAAMKWYTVGAVAGDSISGRELARLQTIRR